MITQYNILKIICYISGNTNIIAGFTVLCQCNLPFLQLEFGNFIGTSSGKHKTIMLSYGDSPVIININKITETDFFFSVCYFFINATDFNSSNVSQFIFFHLHPI